MISCPKCGSRNLRYALLRDGGERWRSWFGTRPLRCRDCRCRFTNRTWDFSGLIYARCPMCWRADLSTWSLKYCHVPAHVSFLLWLGAKPYRCEYCRRNFVSFRKQYERFTFHRWRKLAEAKKGNAEVSEKMAKPEKPSNGSGIEDVLR